MATLAALELRSYLEKLTRARLPIVTEPAGEVPVKIYVGKSAGTEKLGVNASDLKKGAFRIVSGPDWLVLIGDDFDFDPGKYPLNMKRGNKEGLGKWKAATKGKTGGAWAYPWPFSGAFKSYWKPAKFREQLAARYGADAPGLWGPNEGFWRHDENGSLNAVCAFLRSLGVRWYMAGDLGEVLPEKMSDLKLGTFNETVKADYPIRDWTYYGYAGFGFDDLIWARRIGMNSRFREVGMLTGPHGLIFVYMDEEMRQKHPEFFALREDGTRLSGSPMMKECFSSEGLFKETVNFIRFIFDTYDLPAVDIWPADGYSACQCKTCKGKSPSELVFGFANRVAIEVYKTHPDKLITTAAYTVYSEPPDAIEKFSPNLGVWIANSGRARMTDDDFWNDYVARLQKWQSKLAPGNILRSENNRHHVAGKSEADDGTTVRGQPIQYPVIHPRAVARELKAFKGISRGDTGEQSQYDGRWKTPGLEHITLYVQSRFLWDADLDVDEVLNEYCENFYGPAAKQMKAAIDFAEANLALKDQSRDNKRGDVKNVSLKTALKLRDLLDAAKATAGDTIYGRRVQVVIDDLQPREEVIARYQKEGAALAEARAKAPVAKAAEGSDLSKATAYQLQGTVTAGAETTFKAGWDKDALLLEMVCREPEMRNLKVSQDVRKGDHVVVSLETQNHSYYHFVISPDGKVAEGNPTRGWLSLAEVRNAKGSDFWLVTLRIPVVGDQEAEADPNHSVAGSKPTADAPWYFNVGRQRMTGLGKPEIQAFRNTYGNWHNPAQFARLETK